MKGSDFATLKPGDVLVRRIRYQVNIDGILQDRETSQLRIIEDISRNPRKRMVKFKGHPEICWDPICNLFERVNASIDV